MSQYAGQTVGMGFSSFGSLIQGQQTSQLLNYQAEVQTNNANEALSAAKYNADKQQLTANRVMGGISAAAGASGVTGTSGSVLDVMAGSAANAELDKQNLLHGGEVRAVNYENQASMDELGATHAIQASYFNALSSMVAGGGGMLANQIGGSSGGNGTTTASEGTPGGGPSQEDLNEYNQATSASDLGEDAGAL